MKDPKWQGQVRHLLTLLGGIFVMLGWIDQEAVDQLIVLILQGIGVIMTVIGFFKSWRAPEKQ